MLIRDFKLDDTNEIVEILKLNNQYGFPDVDGPAAMRRVEACSVAIFLVCEMDGKVVGSIRGNYDGSRTTILAPLTLPYGFRIRLTLHAKRTGLWFFLNRWAKNHQPLT